MSIIPRRPAAVAIAVPAASSAMSDLVAAPALRCLLSLGLAKLAWRAADPPPTLSTMHTFWAAALVNELPIHALACAFLLARSALAALQAKPSPAAASSPASTSASVAAPAAAVVAAAADAVALAGVVAALLPLVRMSLHQWRARSDFGEAMTRAGVPLARLAAPLPPRKALTCALPLPQLLLSQALVCKRGVEFARVRKRVTSEDAAAGGPRASHTVPLRLDLYWHRERLRQRGGPAPVLCYVHGGGWVLGHRAHHSLPLLYEVARAGWLVATVNYRLASAAPFPMMLHDCKRAVAWLRAHAAEYGGDPSFIAVAGESAGGHLALMMALTPNVAAFQDPAVVRRYWHEGGGEGVGVDDDGADAGGGGPAVAAAEVDGSGSGEKGVGRPTAPTATAGMASLRPAFGDEPSGAPTPVEGEWDELRASTDTSVAAVVDLYGVADWTDSALQYQSWDSRGEGIRGYVGDMVLQRRFRDHATDFVRGSPLWWLHGTELREALRRAFPAAVDGWPAAALADMAVDRTVPPAMIVHGSGDTLVPKPESDLLWRALQRRRARDGGGDADVYVEVPSAHHAFNFVLSPRTYALGDGVSDWLEHVYRRRAASPATRDEGVVRARL